jgi:uncharacterized membrane protein YqjE
MIDGLSCPADGGADVLAPRNEGRIPTMNSTYAPPHRPMPMTAGTRLSLALANIKALVQDHALLAVLEVQRAGVSLVKIIIAGIVISILVVSGWMGLVAAAVGWAVGAGANWALAILVAALVNVAVAVGIAFWAKKQVPDLLFSATLRQLRKDVPHGDNEHEPQR